MVKKNGCFKEMSMSIVFRGNFKKVSRVLQGGSNGVSRKFQGVSRKFKEFLRVFQGSLKGLSRKF